MKKVHFFVKKNVRPFGYILCSENITIFNPLMGKKKVSIDVKNVTCEICVGKIKKGKNMEVDT